MQYSTEFSKLRFSQDSPERVGLSDVMVSNDANLVVNHFKTRHVQISQELFPTLARVIQSVCARFCLESSALGFLSADESINAKCINDARSSAVLWFSSGLVKLLDQQELSFIAGHEIGHWYLKHYQYPAIDESQKELFLARQSLSRAGEISADRFGLLACGDLNIALRAIVKTASGLPDEFLGPDLSTYIRQIREIEVGAIQLDELFASHPPMVLRAKSLIRYTMSNQYAEFSGEGGGLSHADVEAAIEADLEKAFGTAYLDQRDEMFDHLFFWLFACGVVERGQFLKSDQSQMEEAFGSSRVEKLRTLLQGTSVSKARSILEERKAEALLRVAIYSPKDIQARAKQLDGIYPVLAREMDWED